MLSERNTIESKTEYFLSVYLMIAAVVYLMIMVSPILVGVMLMAPSHMYVEIYHLHDCWNQLRVLAKTEVPILLKTLSLPYPLAPLVGWIASSPIVVFRIIVET